MAQVMTSQQLCILTIGNGTSFSIAAILDFPCQITLIPWWYTVRMYPDDCMWRCEIMLHGMHDDVITHDAIIVGQHNVVQLHELLVGHVLQLHILNTNETNSTFLAYL